jgi:malonate decarboxylase delta subunit
MHHTASTRRRNGSETGRTHMERFSMQLESRIAPRGGRPLLCGVVSSGNLEVLIEPTSQEDICRIDVHTSTHGFRAIWKAVLSDFVGRHAAGGLRLSIHDAGATPAVVSLRLVQAIESMRAQR